MKTTYFGGKKYNSDSTEQAVDSGKSTKERSKESEI